MSSRQRRLVDYEEDKVNDFAPHSDGTGSFSSFLLSDQIRKPLNLAALDVVATARFGPHEFDSTGDYVSHFDVDKRAVIPFKSRGVPVHPRAIAIVFNDSPKAAAIEFGSGERSVGTSSGKERPQGGNNRAYRVLGRAAGRIGDWRE